MSRYEEDHSPPRLETKLMKVAPKTKGAYPKVGCNKNFMIPWRMLYDAATQGPLVANYASLMRA